MQISSVKRVGTLMSGTILGQAAVFAATPILARLYTAESFSSFGIYLSLSALFAVISTLRLEGAIPIADNDSDALYLTHASLSICTFTALMSILITFALVKFQVFEIAVSPVAISLLVGGSTFLIGAFQVLSSFQIRREGFRHIAKAKASQGFSLAIFQVALGYLSPTPISFIVGDIFGRASGIYSVSQEYRLQNSNRSEYNFRKIVSKYKRFPVFSAPATFLNTLGVQAPVFILGATISPVILGLFIFANRLITVPASLIAQSMSQVFIGEMGKAKAENINQIPIFIKYVLYSFVISSLFILPFLPFTKYIVPFVFGDKWIAATNILNVLLLLSIAQITSVSVSQTLNLIDRNSWQLLWDVSRLIIVSTTLVTILRYTNDINLIVIYFAIASGAMYIILIGIGLFGLQLNRPKDDQSVANL